MEKENSKLETKGLWQGCNETNGLSNKGQVLCLTGLRGVWQVNGERQVAD